MNNRGALPCVLMLIATPIAFAPVVLPRLEVASQLVADDAPRIRAVGLRPGQRVTLRAATHDSAGVLWTAAADYVAGASGTVDATTQAPSAGAYREVIPAGLITTMDVVGDQRGKLRFVVPAEGVLSVSFVLHADGHTVDSAVTTLKTRSAAVSISALRQHGLVGTLARPVRAGRFPAVLVLGGSEGGTGPSDVAALLAARGYVALALGYFGADGLPAQLDEIPLEYFQNALGTLRRLKFVASDRIAILATSKGTEAALLVSAMDPAIRAVVAYAPSSVVWSCICQPAQHSSWSFQGKGLAAIPPAQDPSQTVARGTPIRPAVHYRYRLEQAKTDSAVLIPVEKIKALLLLIAGEDDQMWPSADMTRAIVARRKAAGRADDRVLLYPSAGHLIGKAYLPSGSTIVGGGRLQTGGTTVGNAAAQGDSWPQVIHFLAAALKPQS